MSCVINMVRPLPQAVAVMIENLSGFIGRAQLSAIKEMCSSEEREFMFSKLAEMVQVVETMPKTYETDGVADPLVYLHYFIGGMDWHITERDIMPEQRQAFGLANHGYGGELGYISIIEITGVGAEIDLHWEPKPLSQCTD